MQRYILIAENVRSKRNVAKIRARLRQVHGVEKWSVKLDKSGKGSLLGNFVNTDSLVKAMAEAGFTGEAVDMTKKLKDIIILNEEGALALQEFLPPCLKAAERGFMDIEEGIGVDNAYILSMAFGG